MDPRFAGNLAQPHAEIFSGGGAFWEFKKSNVMSRGGKREGAGRPRKPPIGAVVPDRPKRNARRRTRANRKPLDAAVRQAKDLTLRLLSELDAVTAHQDELEDFIIAETAGDRDTRRRAAMMRAVDLPSRAATLKLLVAATKAWADLERAAQAKPSSAPNERQGKKERARADAANAAEGTEWSGLVDESGPHH